MTWKVVTYRHKWVAGCTISESVQLQPDGDWSTIRRFTATIRGYRAWRIWEGDITKTANADLCNMVIAKVRSIRDRIDAGDESIFVKEQTK